MVTPSWVIVSKPHFLSRTTLRPLGPSVPVTLRASLLTPAWIPCGPLTKKAMFFAAVPYQLFN